ncbi:MAG: amidohydrolase [Clostridia bacterium]|nr:amidohydrolase [Clostridia bacterium]
MYGIDIRRELHMHPELGYDLPCTLAIIRRELEKLGISYSEEYGKSGIVATINPDAPGKALAIRADIDALPIQEINDVPYKSLHEGKMHACGHDVHTAILLDTARKLTELKTPLKRRIKLIFQPAEESAGGARQMVEAGAVDDVSEIIAIHVNVEPVGTVMFMDGPCNAACSKVTFDFHGKSAHSSLQSFGADAIMMAVHTVTETESYLAKCFPSGAPVVFNCGTIKGGNAANIIADHCTITCHMRAWEDAHLQKLHDAVCEIAKHNAGLYGGEVEIHSSGVNPVLVHDPVITAHMRKAAAEVVGKENIREMKRVMASEDFSFFAKKVPATMMRLGCGNAEKGFVHSVHTPNFDIDERGIDIGSEIYVRYLLNRMEEE